MIFNNEGGVKMNTKSTFPTPLSEPKHHKKEWHVNLETGFHIRRVYGETERFTFHDHDYFEIFLTISGTIKHYINGQTQYLEPGCLVFIRPSDKHLYVYQNEKNYEFVNITLDPEVIDGLFIYLNPVINTDTFLNKDLPPVVRLADHDMQSFMKKVDAFNTFQQEDILAQKTKIRTFLLDTFVKFFINYENNTQSETPIWLDIVCEQMKKTENFTIGIKRMVELSGKTQEHLARSMQKYYHVTLSEYINDLRLNYAVNLIKNTNLKITDICYEAGFGNISTFYSVFQQKFNISPKKFRG